MANLSSWAFIMALFTLLSKTLGFFRESFMAWKFGASSFTDAFIISWNIPLVIFGGVATSILTCYVPVYNRVKEQGKEQVDRFNSNLISIVFLVSLLIILIFTLFDEQIVTTFFIRKEKIETVQYALKFTKIMIWSMLFLGISFILQGYVQVHEKFTIVGLMGIPLNIFIILGIFLATEQNYYFLALGVLLGYVFYIPYFGIPAYKSGFRYRPMLDFQDKNVQKILWLIIPVFLGRMVFDINLMVDRYLGSGLPAGTVTCLNNAYKLNLLVNSVIVTSIGTTIFPRLAKLMKDGDMNAVKKTLHTSLGSMSIFLVPIALAMVVLANPIVSIAFGRGEFTPEKVTVTSQAMQFYCISVISLGWRQIMEKVFYAMEDTKTPMTNAVISIVINIILNIILIRYMQHRGLALATTVSSILTAMLFFVNLQKKIGNFGGRRLFDSFFKTGIAGLIMAFVMKLVYVFTGLVVPSVLVNLMITSIVGMLVYYFMLRTLHVYELTVAMGMIQRRFKK